MQEALPPQVGILSTTAKRYEKNGTYKAQY